MLSRQLSYHQASGYIGLALLGFLLQLLRQLLTPALFELNMPAHALSERMKEAVENVGMGAFYPPEALVTLRERFQIAFSARPKRKRKPNGQSHTPRRSRDYYDNSAASKVYLSVLSNGPSFFVAFLLCVSPRSCRDSTYKKALLKSKPVPIQRWNATLFHEWAFSDGYCGNTAFLQFIRSAEHQYPPEFEALNGLCLLSTDVPTTSQQGQHTSNQETHDSISQADEDYLATLLKALIAKRGLERHATTIEFMKLLFLPPKEGNTNFPNKSEGIQWQINPPLDAQQQRRTSPNTLG
jgi:hypothetical protein